MLVSVRRLCRTAMAAGRGGLCRKLGDRDCALSREARFAEGCRVRSGDLLVKSADLRIGDAGTGGGGDIGAAERGGEERIVDGGAGVGVAPEPT